MNLKYIVDEAHSGKAVKTLLKQELALSERLIKKLKYDGKVFCNSHPVYVNTVVKTGDVVEVTIEFIEDCPDMVPESIPIDILYEDDTLIALNKQPNIVVHPTSSHPSGTVANAVMYHLLQKGISRKIRPVSRLDRDTTGIILFAKNQFVQEFLIRQMTDKTFQKGYLGVVSGVFEQSRGTIDLPIERKPGSIMERHVSPTGAPSVTHYEVVEQFPDASLLKFNLETGRTHQIRVHCQAAGHPLIGDTLYSDQKTELIHRQALHSHTATFIHPYSKQFLSLSAPMPEDMAALIRQLKSNENPAPK